MPDEAQERPVQSQAGDRWGDPISTKRQAELMALADQQRDWAATPDSERGESHFEGVDLTGADVF